MCNFLLIFINFKLIPPTGNNQLKNNLLMVKKFLTIMFASVMAMLAFTAYSNVR